MPRTGRFTTLLVAVLVVAAAGPAVALAGTAGGFDDAANAEQACSFPMSTEDATGAEVTVAAAPESVVTLSPSAAQTMWEIGARDTVVGVTKFATYLEGADERTNVSGAGRTTVVVEQVVGLQPDLVLVPNATNNLIPGKVTQLRDAGITVYVFDEAKSLDDISAKTRLTGRLVGACDGAEAAAGRMEADLATVREAVAGEERPDVLVVLGSYGYTAGSGTFIDTAVTTAGGVNVAAEEGIAGYQPISNEVVADRDPDWIVKPAGAQLPDSPAYNGSTAVQEGNVVTVDDNFISQPAPQIVRPIVTIAQALHPEAYAEANATATPSPTDTVAPQTSSSPTTTAPPETTTTRTANEASGPGFGLAAAVLALAGAVLLVRRD